MLIESNREVEDEVDAPSAAAFVGAKIANISN